MAKKPLPSLDLDNSSETPKTPDVEDSSALLICTNTYGVVDPYTNIRFNPGQPVNVLKISGYMQVQLDAGILKKVSAGEVSGLEVPE